MSTFGGWCDYSSVQLYRPKSRQTRAGLFVVFTWPPVEGDYLPRTSIARQWYWKRGAERQKTVYGTHRMTLLIRAG